MRNNLTFKNLHELHIGFVPPSILCPINGVQSFEDTPLFLYISNLANRFLVAIARLGLQMGSLGERSRSLTINKKSYSEHLKTNNFSD